MEYTIRPLSKVSEYRACLALQDATWGAGFSERVPLAILKVSQRLGGVTAGAFDTDDRLCGFVFGMTGMEDGRAVHWSDMLAVLPELRGRGLGGRLKRYQRQALRALGVKKVYWTFDPLESRNAYLNFAKLGVLVREYQADMYGDSTDSTLDRGIGTDRCIATWLIDSPRVVSRLEGVEARPSEEALARAEPVMEVSGQGLDVEPGEPRAGLTSEAISVAIPADMQELKSRSLDRARRWRQTTRKALSTYIDRGYEIHDVVRAGALSHYLLRRHEADPPLSTPES